MNGWQRLGVLASVIWLLGMWTYVSGVQDKQYVRDWQLFYGVCRDRPHEPNRESDQVKECKTWARKQAEAFCCNGVSPTWDRSSQSWPLWFVRRMQDQIIAAVLMIPLWWLLAYACLRFGRIVRRAVAKR